MTASRAGKLLVLSLALLFSSSTVGIGQKTDKKKKKTTPTGTPVLWRGHGDIPTLDLRYGSGSAGLAPISLFPQRAGRPRLFCKH
jgi:hypothetical protein